MIQSYQSNELNFRFLGDCEWRHFKYFPKGIWRRHWRTNPHEFKSTLAWLLVSVHFIIISFCCLLHFSIVIKGLSKCAPNVPFQKGTQNIPKKNFATKFWLKFMKSFTDCPIPCSSFCSMYDITMFTCFFGSCFLILSLSFKLILVSGSFRTGVVLLLLVMSLFLFCSKRKEKFWRFKKFVVGFCHL